LDDKFVLLPLSLCKLRIDSEPHRADCSTILRPSHFEMIAKRCLKLEEFELELVHECLDCRLFRCLKKLTLLRVDRCSSVIGSPTLQKVVFVGFTTKRLVDSLLEGCSATVEVVHLFGRRVSKLDWQTNVRGVDLWEIVHEEERVLCEYCAASILSCCVEDHLVVCREKNISERLLDWLVVCPFCLQSVKRSEFERHSGLHNSVSGAVPRALECEMGCFRRGTKFCPRKVGTKKIILFFFFSFE
jgi:hypothetical protein